MRTLGRVLAVGVVAVLAVFAWRALRPEPRWLFVGGPVVTLDAEDRVVEALAVTGQRITAAGSADVLRAWAAKEGAEVVELGGRALLPGFIDAHGHFPGAGFEVLAEDLNSPPIGDVRSLDELLGRLRERAAATDAGDWVLGMGYDDTLLAEGRHPTRADLDAVTTEHPLAALHISGHLASANSRALAWLGYDASTPDPEGGRIRRDAAGEPDGVLEESAMEPLAEVLFKPSLLDTWRVLRSATELYLAAGVTTAQNGFATREQVRGLVLASRLGLLRLRVVAWPDEVAADAIADGELGVGGVDPLWLRIGAVKLVADGSIQGYTGYLSEPYHVPPGDDPGYRGYPRIPREALIERVGRQHARGEQLAVHGNGDASIDDILDALEAAKRETPRPDARPVIVHAQMARDDQLDRMAGLGAIPSFFVLHTYYWGDRHRDIFMGPERAARMSPTRSAEERGLRFTLHADTPVVPMEPLRVVWAAVNRRSASGAPIGEAQRIGVVRALRGVTLDAARQHFEEADKGSLEKGKLADLVVLDRSPLDDPAGIDRIRVLETWVGGRRVWRAKP